MPELPEVEVVRRGLEPHVAGRVIREVTIHEPRSARRQAGGPAQLRRDLEEMRVSAIVRRGKFLWWRLADPRTGEDPGHALMAHLGMSGQLRVRSGGGVETLPPAEPEVPADDPEDAQLPAQIASEVAGGGEGPEPARHRRITLDLEGDAHVDLVDQRIFGGLWTSPLVPTGDAHTAGAGSQDDLIPESASHIARDVMDPAADLPAVARTLRTRRASIKSLLLAQDVVSGIGNIYADEALWAARTHHETPGAALSPVRAHRILRECRAVMERALAVGGTSFDALYVNVDGRSGYFARSLSAYGRTGEPCPRCGTLIVRRTFMNRSSHFCPRCQRKR